MTPPSVTPRLCRLCGERPPVPSRARGRDYRCGRCIHRTPGAMVRQARYNAGPKRKAVVKKHNARRVLIGGTYHSAARTEDEAARINAHIKEKRLEFVKGQQNRKEAQGAPAR